MRILKKISLYIAAAIFSTQSYAANSVESDSEKWHTSISESKMTWDYIPMNWREAPHFGNAEIGSMIFTNKGYLRIQLCRPDVQDHRDDSYGWTAYSRPRLLIGDFYLRTAGKIKKFTASENFWDAELTGIIETDKGTVKIRHFVHALDSAIVTEIEPSEGEKNCRWEFVGADANSTRDDYPKTKEDIQSFAKKYGAQYLNNLKLYKKNPAGYPETKEGINLWVQKLMVGGETVVAWKESTFGNTRRMIATIQHSFPKLTAEKLAKDSIAHYDNNKTDDWLLSHRDWWHNFYKKSYISIPDKELNSVYWRMIFRYGCNSRTNRNFISTSGMWFQGGRWPYNTNDHNTQMSHWAVYSSNHLELGQELVESIYRNRQNLIDSVVPAEWKSDSSFLDIVTDGSFYSKRGSDKRYVNLAGCLTWVMHNCWLQYRYSMDDNMLREKIYPILRRAINYYMHLMTTGKDGEIHLTATNSPEYGPAVKDCNFSLGLFRWGCKTLLEASTRLNIDDPLRPQWKNILDKLVDYPTDDDGFMTGANLTSPEGHRHGSHFIMAYPLYLVNIDQAENLRVLENTYLRYAGKRCHTKDKRLLGDRLYGNNTMLSSYAASLATAIGRGNDALKHLYVLRNGLHRNELWNACPCIEVPLSICNIIQDMLIQSWGNKIRVFPSMPDEWQNASFEKLRTEGAFLVDAVRKNGKTEYIKIESLAGEPCVLVPNFDGDFQCDNKSIEVKEISKGTYGIALKKGETVVLQKK